MLSDVLKNTVLVVSVVIPILIVIIQIYRFWHMEEEYSDVVKDYLKMSKDKKKKDLSSQIKFGNMEMKNVINPNSVKQNDDPINDFIRMKNSKAELFKLYVIVPLESYFYIVFMIGTIYALGYFIAFYLNNPMQGVSVLASAIRDNWIGALFLFAVFMHRLVLKKIEDLVYLKMNNVEGQFNKDNGKGDV